MCQSRLPEKCRSQRQLGIAGVFPLRRSKKSHTHTHTHWPLSCPPSIPFSSCCRTTPSPCTFCMSVSVCVFLFVCVCECVMHGSESVAWQGATAGSEHVHYCVKSMWAGAEEHCVGPCPWAHVHGRCMTPGTLPVSRPLWQEPSVAWVEPSATLVACRIVACRLVPWRAVAWRVVARPGVACRRVAWRAVSWRVLSWRAVPCRGVPCRGASCRGVRRRGVLWLYVFLAFLNSPISVA